MTDRQSQEPAVPVGLEQVLLMVGVEPRFARVLHTEPKAALAASGVALSKTERDILRTVPAERLEQMAARVVSTAPEPTRRVFLSRASAVVVALGGGAVLAAGCGEKRADPGKAGAAQGDDQAMAQMTMARHKELRRRHRVQAPTGIRPGPFPHVSVGDPKIEGGLDPKIVKQTLLARSSVIKRCWFGTGGRRTPGGKLRLSFTVDGAGKVAKASVNTGSSKPNPIESCVLAAARGWTFPPSKPRPTKIQVEYTFEFRY
jgi:TonB family protein